VWLTTKRRVSSESRRDQQKETNGWGGAVVGVCEGPNQKTNPIKNPPPPPHSKPHQKEEKKPT